MSLPISAPPPPCTFIWDSIYLEIIDNHSDDTLCQPLPSDLAIAKLVTDYESHLVKWIITQLSMPITMHVYFWFYRRSSEETGTWKFLLGKISHIHRFIGRYALIQLAYTTPSEETAKWKHQIYWIDQDSLLLTPKQKRLAYQARLLNPNLSLIVTNN
jgi:hypothetical protein